MANSKLLSGRIPVTPYSELTSDRYQFLGLNQAEPSLGPGSANAVLTLSTGNVRTWSNTLSVTSVTATGNISANYITGNGYYLTGVTTNTANYVIQNNQPNITSVGTLTSLDCSGYVTTDSIKVTSTANIAGSLKVSGVVTFSTSPNVSLCDAANLHIGGGSSGYVLTTDGAGNLSWTPSGNGAPGGSNTQIQYNNAGGFAGSPFLTFNSATNNVNIGGNLIANTITLGAGAYKYSTTSAYSATTNSSVPNQAIFSLPALNLAGADYVIISTDASGGIRNYVKISAVIYNGTVHYTETFTLPIGGYVGDFQVVYNAGNIIADPSMDLIFSPQSANLTTHKMMITRYSD